MAPGFEIPDAIEPVYAWRSWLARGGPVLGSVSTTVVRWPLGEVITAECQRSSYGTNRDPHVSPHESCQCGLYATFDPKEPWLYVEGFLPERWVVIGVAAFWGKTILGEKGVRAEKAYPEFFVLCPPMDEPILKYKSPYSSDPIERGKIGVQKLEEAYNRPVLMSPRLASGWTDLLEARKLFMSESSPLFTTPPKEIADLVRGSSVSGVDINDILGVARG